MASASGLGRGTIVGKCEIIEAIGRGGMGAVYRCRHRTLQIDVALKIMSFSAATEEEKNSLVQRFFREAHAAARIRHEHVVSVLDVDSTPEGMHYMLMELVDGTSVKKLIEGGPLDPRLAARLARDTAKGLGAAHILGIVHRDVKPENILLTKDHRVKISDFGIASVGQDAGDDEGPKLTQTGQVVGTPHYMSPEQVNGDLVDGRADIYSLGATLYHLLTGTFPFRGTSAFQVCMKHVMEMLERPKARVPAIPDALDELVVSMMAKKPADRPQTVDAVVDALEMWLSSARTMEMRGYAEMATGAPVFVRAPVPAPSATADGAPPTITPTPSGATPIRLNTDAAKAKVTTGALLQALSPEDSASMTLAGQSGPGPGASAVLEGVAGDATLSGGVASGTALSINPPPAYGAPLVESGVPGTPPPRAPAAMQASTPPPVTTGQAEKAKGWSETSTPTGWGGGLTNTLSETATGDPARGENAALSAVMRVRGLSGAPSRKEADRPAAPQPGAPAPKAPGKPAARADAPRRQTSLLRGAVMIAAVVGAGFIGYKDGLHERTLKPLFLKMGWGWPPAALARLGLGAPAPTGPGTVITGSTGGSTAGSVLAIRTIAAEELAKGTALQREGHVREALEAFDRVIGAPATDPTLRGALPAALFQSAALLEQRGGPSDLAEALARYDRLLQLTSGEASDIRTATIPLAQRLRDRLPPPPTPLTPEEPVTCHEPADRLQVAELDGDGHADVAVWGGGMGIFLLTQGAGEQRWVLQWTLNAGEDRSVAEGRERAPLLGISPADGTEAARPLRATRETLADATPVSGPPPSRAEAADLWGDGASDIVFWTPGQPKVQVRRRDGSRRWLPAMTVDLGGPAVALASGALVGPVAGIAALTSDAPASGAPPGTPRYRLVLLSIDRAGTLAARPIASGITARAPVVALSDFSGDGLGDIAASTPGDPSGQSLAIWRRDAAGAYALERAPVDLGLVPLRLIAAPVGDAGAAGLVAAAAGDDGSSTVIGTYVPRATGGLRCAALIPLTGRRSVACLPKAIGAGDIDGDGASDLVLLLESGITVIYRDPTAAGIFGPSPRR